MPRARTAAAMFVCTALVSASCTSRETPPSSPSPVGPSPDVVTALHTLAARAIYFGHQSVGYNIMDGVQALISASPAPVPAVVETSAAASMAKGLFTHAGNGSNGDPAGKIAAFQATISGGVGARVDIALFKFCFVDFDTSTNVTQLFADYSSTLAALEGAYPGVRFVHVTVPLTTGASDENAVREGFSDLVRQAYAGREPLFDLAKVESTRPDGTTETVNGVRALVASYSSDGGHLNAAGQEVVARALIACLGSL